MKVLKHLLWAFFAAFLMACGADEPQEEQEGQITFTIENVLNQKSGGRTEADAADITYALITIENDQGDVVMDREQVNVSPFGDGFITDPVTLITGDYNLTEFILMNDADEVIFATPLAGSDLAYLVSNPLPLAFTITANSTTELAPEVIDVTASVPEQYGYFGMNFTIIETFDLMITVLEQDASGSYNPVSYQLAISSQGAQVTSKALPSGVSVIKLRSDITEYTLDVTSNGGYDFSRTYGVSELTAHDIDSSNPLTILVGPDGGTSVGDPCSLAAECGPGFTCSNNTCQVDADGDGNPDEICGDGIDNDFDGDVDEGCSGQDADGDGHTTDAGDCDDGDANVHPGAVEVCGDMIDNNCNGIIDENCGTDADGDGVTAENGDCDDLDPAVYPGAAEICGDMIDNDCDGFTDENCGTDADGDGVTLEDGDCDDSDATVYPGATEICGDGVDNNCNGVIDENCANVDNDGDGQSAVDGDCDDTNPTVHLGAAEICDGIDNDCDGFVDEDCSYSDIDGDGVTVGAGDCDDFNSSIYPGATDVCGDNLDNDCNGIVDDNCQDNDGDGFTVGDGDCNDNNATVYPGAPEICGDGIDNDCNGAIENEVTYYRDADGDGFGSFTNTTTSCSGPPPGFTFTSSDCNDFDPMIYPGAPEICDGQDSNCNGIPDDGCTDPQ